MVNVPSNPAKPPDYSPVGPVADSVERVEVGSLLSDLWRRKSYILLATIVGAALSYAAISRLEPTYTARASFMVDPSRVQLLTADEVVTNPVPNERLLDSLVAVLQSNLLLEEVIAGFAPGRIASLDPATRPPSVLAQARGEVRAAARAGLERVGLLEGADAPAGASLLSEEERRMRRLVGAFRAATSVWREGESYIFNVAVATGDPELSALIANAVVRTYIDQRMQERRSSVRSANAFLEDRVASTAEAVAAAEEAVDAHRARQIAENGVSPEIVEQQLRDLSTHLTLASADLAQAQARYDQITTVIDEGGIAAAAELLTSPFVVSLRQELSELARADAELATRVSAVHPNRQRIANQRALVAGDLSAEVRQIVGTIRNDMDVARIRVDSIRDSLLRLEGRVSEMSRATLELRRLERQAEAVRNSHGALLVRLNETRPVEELQAAGARVVERAVIPGGPSGPRKALFTALGATAAFAASLLLVFLAVVSRGGFMRPSELEQAAGLPVLAVLPRGRWRRPRGMLKSLRRAPYQTFADRLRRLRGAMLPTARGGGAARRGRTLLLTSSVGREGVTSTALGLAHLEARTGRSVVVVDFDLRRTRLSRDLRHRSGPGLGEVLRSTAALEDAVGQVSSESFDLLTLARPDPDLVDAIDPGRIHDLLERLGESYDLVLIDAPPVLRMAETLTLAPLVDRVLLLVRQGITRRGAVQETVRLLRGAGAHSVHGVLSIAGDEAEGWSSHAADAGAVHGAA